MTIVTKIQLNTARKNLETFTREAKKRLFEFETLANAYEAQRGNTTSYKTAAAFMRAVSK